MDVRADVPPEELAVLVYEWKELWLVSMVEGACRMRPLLVDGSVPL
jgi:hypothetical protein